MVVGDAHVFPGFLTPVLTQLFFPKPPTTFLSCFCRGERWKYAGKKSRLNWGSNSQPPGHESDTLTTKSPGWGVQKMLTRQAQIEMYCIRPLKLGCDLDLEARLPNHSLCTSFHQDTPECKSEEFKRWSRQGMTDWLTNRITDRMTDKGHSYHPLRALQLGINKYHFYLKETILIILIWTAVSCISSFILFNLMLNFSKR